MFERLLDGAARLFAASAMAALAVVLAPVAAISGGAFDGSWNVNILCANAPDGALGYSWQFPAQVSNGSLVGQYRQPGNPNSGTLSGQIQTNGDALLKMEGLTGRAEHNIGRAPPGTPFMYTVTGHFAGRSGSGKRDQVVARRSCDLTFTKN
jgi:hypothetical protein